VLKNISETALYGIRGVDGVIIISTKKASLRNSIFLIIPTVILKN